MAHLGQSRRDYGLGIQVKALKIFKVVPLRSATVALKHGRCCRAGIQMHPVCAQRCHGQAAHTGGVCSTLPDRLDTLEGVSITVSHRLDTLDSVMDTPHHFTNTSPFRRKDPHKSPAQGSASHGQQPRRGSSSVIMLVL